MENHLLRPDSDAFEAVVLSDRTSSSSAFIEANTQVCSLYDIQEHHIIPVYSKDNEPLISYGDFVNATIESVYRVFSRETILDPAIRVSHPVKGRIPQARNKPAKDLFEWEKTIYYERAAFVIEIPSIQDTVGGNPLSLTVGGVKAYNMDSLHQKKGADEHFKVFIGFQNKVCTNLCVASDGYVGNLRVKSVDQLIKAITDLISCYQAEKHLQTMAQLTDYSLSESQFAQLMGRCRLYQFLPPAAKKDIPLLLLGDQQFGPIARDYYRDTSFCRLDDGSISLWKVYNLFTGAVKSSYIDTFMDRNVNAFDLTRSLMQTVQSGGTNWFLQ
jgi:hypothetical protein